MPISIFKRKKNKIFFAVCFVIFSFIARYSNIFQTIYYNILIHFKEPIPCNKVYVLNLDTAKKRMKNVSNILLRNCIKYTRFRAIDGKELNIINEKTNEKFTWDMLCDHKNARNITTILRIYHPDYPDVSFNLDYREPFEKYILSSWRYLDERPVYNFKIKYLGELGCAYSHRAIWKNIVDKNYDKVIVLEDDICLSNKFRNRVIKILKNIPKTADIVYIDGNNINPQKLSIIPGNKYIYSIKAIFGGTHAYIITNKGARKLLDKTRLISLAIDIQITSLIKSGELEAYISSKKIAYSKESEFESNIIDDKRNLSFYVKNFYSGKL